MPRFFVDAVEGDTVLIAGEDARHIVKSLRMQTGEQVILCDRNEVEHYCTIASLGDTVTLHVDDSVRCENEPTLKAVLFQALPKGDKFDFIIQKAVELGITRIVPVLTERCVSRPDAKSMQKKLVRYNKIALEAAKQCGRGIVPTVEPLVSYDEALRQMQNYESAMLFYELGGERIEEILPADAASAAFMIGSEGGFSETEYEQAKASGIRIATLGKRILRCETAPLAALTLMMYISKNI